MLSGAGAEIRKIFIHNNYNPFYTSIKLNRLDDLLLGRHYQPILLNCVAEEVLRGPFEHGEERPLKRFLDSVVQVSQNVTLPIGGA
jgi:hypothetical protein